MPDCRYLLMLCLPVLAVACGEPKCPTGYMKYGDLCRKCPPGEERERGRCVQILDGGLEADERDAADGEGDKPAADEDAEIVDGETEPRPDVEQGDGQSTIVTDAGPAEQGDAETCSSEPHCQSEECTPTLCLNGGVCRPSTMGATCDCSGTGYEGATCESDIDECAQTDACPSPDYPCVQTVAPGYVCQGQFADWPMPDALGASKAKPDYDITAAPGIVIDKITELEWQRTLPGTQFSVEAAYGGCTGMRVSPGDGCTWTEAKAYCENLVLAGRNEWRLPTKIELESITDHTRSNPAIDPVFPNTPIDNFWTSSRVSGRLSDAWYVFAGSGGSAGVIPPAVASVRCVHGMSRSVAPASRYLVDAAADSVTDTRTNLVWQRSISTTKQTWTNALSHCQGRGTGWRLPSVKELLTLVDPSRKVPAIDISAFPSTPRSDNFWSATPAVDASPYVAWYVAFNEGGASMTTNAELWVRCVR